MIYTWLYDKDNNKISPYVSLNTLLTEEDSESKLFKTQYDTDLAKKVDKDQLSSIATSGSYTDILNKPTINGVTITGALTSAILKLADQNHTHQIADILNMPTLLSQFTNDCNFITSEVLDKYALISSLSAVATSGSYNDLINKPKIVQVTKTSELQNDSDFITSKALTPYTTTNDLAAVALDGKYSSLSDTPNLFSGSYNDLTDKPSYATVASTGSYNDLLDKPAPGTNISKVSELENDVGYITSSALSEYTKSTAFASVALSGKYTDLTDIPTIPSKTSDLTNDSNYITNSALNDYTKTQNLATVATSGNYNDLSNQPTYATVASTGEYGDLKNTPSLATVATSGSYNDLNNLPVVFNATSVTNLCNTLGPILGGTLTGVWDEAISAYIFTFTPSETA